MPRGRSLGWTDSELDLLAQDLDFVSSRSWWESSANRNADRVFENEDGRGRVDEQPERRSGYVATIAAITLPILFDPSTGEFTDATGRAIRRSVLDSELLRVIKETRRLVDDLFNQMRDGTITISEWQARMRDLIRDVHTSSAALGRGGFTRFNLRDLERLHQHLRFHYERLQAFAEEIENQEILLGGRERIRAGLYIRSARGIFFQFEITKFQERGFTEEMNILAPIEKHCPDCPVETSRGWVEIGTLIPIGERACMMNCLCGIEYRHGTSGKIIRW